MIISREEIIEIAFTYTTSDPSLIKDHKIVEVANKLVKSCIGADLWEEIKGQLEDCDTLTDLNKTLWDNYIKYIVAYGVYVDLLPKLIGQSSSSGLQYLVPENTQNDQLILNQHKEHGINSYRHYQEMMIDYIKENKSDYPLYKQQDKDIIFRNGIVFY